VIEIVLKNLRKAALAARAADDKKGEGIVVLDLRGVCTFTDYFVIASGTSYLQLRAMAEAIRESLRADGHGTPAVDGERQATWIALDYDDVVVHLMQPESRDYYRLEDLWGDGKVVEWVEEAATAEA